MAVSAPAGTITVAGTTVAELLLRMRLMSGEQHGDPLWHACTDQVARGRASAIVKQTMGYLRFPARIAEGGPPFPNRHAVAAEYSWVLFVAPPHTSLQYLTNGLGDW